MDKGQFLTGLSNALWTMGGGEGLSPTVMMQMQKQAEKDTAARLEAKQKLEWEHEDKQAQLAFQKQQELAQRASDIRQQQDREKTHREGQAEAYKYGPAYEEAYAKYDPNNPFQTAPVGHMLPQFQEGAATRTNIFAQQQRDKQELKAKILEHKLDIAKQSLLTIDPNDPSQSERWTAANEIYQDVQGQLESLGGMTPTPYGNPVPTAPLPKPLDPLKLMQLGLTRRGQDINIGKESLKPEDFPIQSFSQPSGQPQLGQPFAAMPGSPGAQVVPGAVTAKHVANEIKGMGWDTSQIIEYLAKDQAKLAAKGINPEDVKQLLGIPTSQQINQMMR